MALKGAHDFKNKTMMIWSLSQRLVTGQDLKATRLEVKIDIAYSL